MKIVEWIKNGLGFTKNPKYQNQYINDSNIRMAFFMSAVIIILEAWMLVRYIIQRPGLSFLQYFDGETNYLILFSAALLVVDFSVRYMREMQSYNIGRIIALCVVLLDVVMIVRFVMTQGPGLTELQIIAGTKYMLISFIMALFFLMYDHFVLVRGIREDIYGQILLIMFSMICIGFGIETSMYDITKGRQILCFVTMLLFVACMLIWKPYASIAILGMVFIYFYVKWRPHLEAIDTGDGKLVKGDTINYFMLWIALVMVSISLYHQRRQEARKDERLMSTNEELTRIANEDELTGIHNISYFYQEASYTLRDQSTDVSDKIFLFLNIENFKTYNDQIGYQAGNEYLCKLAHLIRDTFNSDAVARLSDDHFVILTDAAVAEEKTGIIRDAIHESASDVYLELKVGAYRPVARDLDPRIAVDYARYACGLTKKKFDLNYIEYDEEVDKTFHKRQYIVNNLDNAIMNGYIRPYYQPVVWADNREPCGAEALARWIDPTYGFLSPADFIPVLEDNRQIHKLDEYILQRVCKDFREGMNTGIPLAPVSINFSRLDFEMMDVPAKLEEITHKYGVSRDLIHVEITESALADDDGLIEEAMEKIRELGYEIWLDDFGSGYSSLNVLKDYHFDMMKIDMQFLQNFKVEGDASIIINTIIQLAEDLKMMSLTEGVESEDVADFLAKSGCGRLQGYYFGRPMPIEELRSMIEKNLALT